MTSPPNLDRRDARVRVLRASALAVVVLASRVAAAQAVPPAAHEDTSFDFMNVLAQHGLHDLSHEAWNAYGQVTLIDSYKAPFAASGTNVRGSAYSLLPTAENGYTGSATLFVGAKLWHGAEAYLVPEIIAERPLSGLHGIGGAIQDFELQKTGSEIPQIYRSRTYVRQTFGFGGETVAKTSDPMQLAAKVDRRRLVVTLGNFSILDFFDKNGVLGDSRQGFLNMAFMTHASWDFPSDARGYSYGGVAELYWDDWAMRIGRITPPINPNQLPIDFRLWEFYGDEVELEHDHTIGKQPGAIRLLGYRNRVDTGRFDDAIANFEAHAYENATGCHDYVSQNANAPGLCWVRRPNVKLGIGVDLEQHVTDDFGLFFRAMYSDGQTEVDAFNPADRSLSVGFLSKGGMWKRPLDVTGLGYSASWISSEHAAYLAMGGMDGFIGDGFLRHEAPESVIEVFYSVNFVRALWLTADFQHLANPGYNADRGPVNIASTRLHAEF